MWCVNMGNKCFLGPSRVLIIIAPHGRLNVPLETKQLETTVLIVNTLVLVVHTSVPGIG